MYRLFGFPKVPQYVIHVVIVATYRGGEIMEFTVQLDPRGFSKKPTEEETRIIRKTIKPVELSLFELRDKLCYGHTVCPAIFEETGLFAEQQVFFVDVDGGRTVEENLKIAEERKILPNIIYKTFSGNAINQKHRLVFVLDRPIRNIRERNRLQRQLNDIFGGDERTSDEKRLFYGGNVCYFYNPFDCLCNLKGGNICNAAI